MGSNARALMVIPRLLFGIARNWRKLEAVGQAANEDAAASGAPPEQQHGAAAGLANVLLQATASARAVAAERRGGPLPGSDPAVADGSAWPPSAGPASAGPASLRSGAEAIRARDGAFDPGLLARFGGQVFAATAALSAGADSGTVRPVMSDELWEPLAAYSAMVRRKPAAAKLNILTRLGPQQAAAEVTGLHAGSWYDSAMIVMHVHVARPLPPDVPPGLPAEMTAWDEDWLFQRSVRPGGDPMIRPPACPSCGAPARLDGTGNCLHCRAPVPFLTAGWLVCGIVSHHPMYRLIRERSLEAAAADPDMWDRLPPDLRRSLGADPPGRHGG